MTIRWVQSNNGKKLHLCRLEFKDGFWVGPALCNSRRPKGMPWNIKPEATNRCPECERRIQFVLDAITYEGSLDNTKPVCESATV